MGKYWAARPDWLQNTLITSFSTLFRIISLWTPEDWDICSFVDSKAMVYSTNVWDNFVSARWQVREVNLRFGCQLLIFPSNLPQHDSTDSVDRFLPGVAVHQNCECLNVINRFWLYRPFIPKFSERR